MRSKPARMGKLRVHLYNCLLKAEQYQTHWGYYFCLADRFGTLHVNDKTRSDKTWFKTLLHEFMHAAEHCEGVELNHDHLNRIAGRVAEGLMSAGLVDPSAVRAAYIKVAVDD